MAFSWACTIHKSQGKPLDKAVIDFDTAEKCSDMIFVRGQFPLMLSWACKIHKSHGRTLDKAVIDLGKAEKCTEMILLAPSRVRKLRHLLLRPFSFEHLKKIKKEKKY